MAGRRLEIEEAAQLIEDADPLTEIRITLAWDTSEQPKRPMLRLSSRSVVNYKAKAKPMGSIRGPWTVDHSELLSALAGAMYSAGAVREQAADE